ncbi:MAG: hypothetical protein KDA83_05050 [Planctomycetales bacterium]|nr:hypothetical protein [Planctomycetales bacterium]
MRGSREHADVEGAAYGSHRAASYRSIASERETRFNDRAAIVGIDR